MDGAGPKQAGVTTIKEIINAICWRNRKNNCISFGIFLTDDLLPRYSFKISPDHRVIEIRIPVFCCILLDFFRQPSHDLPVTGFEKVVHSFVRVKLQII